MPDLTRDPSAAAADPLDVGPPPEHTRSPAALARELSAALTRHGLWRAGMVLATPTGPAIVVLVWARHPDAVLDVCYPGSPPIVGALLAARAVPDLAADATVGVLLGLLTERQGGHAVLRVWPELATAARDVKAIDGSWEWDVCTPELAWTDDHDAPTPGAALARALLAALR